MHRIGLVMIVKNESKIIQRCLSSVVGIIDEYMIVDTGSTDETIQVIKDFFKDYPKISGTVESKRWVDFGHNRTESLQLAKKKLDVDWLLTVDADMVLVDLGFRLMDLNPKIGAYQIYQKNSVLKYTNIRLMNNKYNWKSIGVTHEYLASEENSRDILESIYIQDIGDGGSKLDKFERDINLLEQGLKDEPDNSRYKFYLANSYKDTQQWAKAIQWYQKRIEDGGWLEEVTCSYEYLGKCYESLEQHNNALGIWLKGYDYNPTRAECIYNAARILRIQGNNLIGYLLIQKAKEIPFPQKDTLFIQIDVYDFLIDYELTIMSYYANPKNDIRNIFRDLIPKNLEHLYDTIISNYKFYCKSIKNLEIAKIDFDNILKIDGFHNSSPGIIKNEKGYLVNLRHVSYEIDKNTGAYLEASDKSLCKIVNTLNSRIQLNKSFEVVNIKTYETPDYNKNYANGIEDIRLFNHGSVVKFSGNHWEKHEKINVVTGDYDENESKLTYLVLDSPFTQAYEKNWAAFLHKDKLKWIYNWSPIQIGEINNEKFTITETKSKFLYNFRGSSPGVVVDNQLWFLTHCVEHTNPRRYYHAFVILDNDSLEYIKHSNLFTFESKKIEFAVGMEIIDNKLIITHSTWDSKAYLKVYDFNKLKIDLFA